MILEGTLEEIIFRNEENGYTVAMLSHGDVYTTVVGVFLSISEGMCVKLSGKYITNNKYGEQFSFDSSEIVYPSSEDGIRKYLSSGLIKGIGPVTADAIVKMFKKETFDIIEFNPALLTKVKGISPAKAESIANAFSELKKFQNTVIFLQKYNITTNTALKIYNAYQDKAISLISQNPYCLVEDIEGIGFASADKIAQSMGLDEKSKFRIRAGFLHILNEASEKGGNTYLPKVLLCKKLCALTELEFDLFLPVLNEVLESLKFDKVITMFYHEKVEVVMLVKFYFVETSVAQKLALLNLNAKKNADDVTSEINAFEMTNKIKFDLSQKEAIKNGVQNGVSIITGGPGTGKTTIIKCIITILKQKRSKVMLMAPTGRAAKRLSESTNMQAKTIHRALEVDFKGDKRVFVHNESNLLDIDVCIVDEVSMVDVLLMNSLLKALKRDCKLILVGDKDQLPSVGAGNVLADILSSKIIDVSYLTKIFRQDEKSLIIENAHKINNGEMPTIDNASTDFFFDEQTELSSIKQNVIEMVTLRIPKFIKEESSKIQVLAPLKAGVCGVENLNKSLQDKINPPSAYKIEVVVGSTIFRIGDKVMQTSNNYDLTWTKQTAYMQEEGAGVFNGDIGYILSINRQTGETLVVFDDGRQCVYPRSELSQLALAYCITIHKSQGSEFDVVVIPVINGTRMILTKNLIYTAVTRAKKMVVLVGEKKNLAMMISNKYTQERYTMLAKFLKTAHDDVVSLYG